MHMAANLRTPASSKLRPTDLNKLKEFWEGPFWEAFVKAYEDLKDNYPDVLAIGPAVGPKLALLQAAHEMAHHDGAKTLALKIVKIGTANGLTPAKSLKLR